MAGARTQGAGRGVNWGAYGNIVSALLEGGRAQAQGIAQFGAGVGGAIGNYRQEKRQDAAAKAEADYRAQRDATEQSRWEATHRLSLAQFGALQADRIRDDQRQDQRLGLDLEQEKRQQAEFDQNRIKTKVDALSKVREVWEYQAALARETGQESEYAKALEKLKSIDAGFDALAAQLSAGMQPPAPAPQAPPQAMAPAPVGEISPAPAVDFGGEDGAQREFGRFMRQANAGWDGDFANIDAATKVGAVVKSFIDEQDQYASKQPKNRLGIARIEQARRLKELAVTYYGEIMAGLQGEKQQRKQEFDEAIRGGNPLEAARAIGDEGRMISVVDAQNRQQAEFKDKTAREEAAKVEAEAKRVREQEARVESAIKSVRKTERKVDRPANETAADRVYRIKSGLPQPMEKVAEEGYWLEDMDTEDMGVVLSLPDRTSPEQRAAVRKELERRGQDADLVALQELAKRLGRNPTDDEAKAVIGAR